MALLTIQRSPTPSEDENETADESVAAAVAASLTTPPDVEEADDSAVAKDELASTETDGSKTTPGSARTCCSQTRNRRSVALNAKNNYGGPCCGKSLVRVI
uniref:Uncharacterized protein n=1 Tax=Plectus sambesii TaxID=2011161 RepID=A0A914VPW2_9BILA